MSGFEFDADQDLEDSENLYGDNFWSGRDATIYLIDSCPKMFSSFGSEDQDQIQQSPFLKSIKCAHSTVSQKIVGNDQDLYAVILFNTESNKNSLDFPNIYVLQDIDRPGAERMIELESILDGAKDQAVKDKYGSTNKANLSDVFWVCRSIIRSKKNISTKNILLFTSEDDPHPGDDHKRKLARKGAKDLKEEGIDIEVLAIGSSFDSRKFYKDLLMPEGDHESGGSLTVLANPTEDFDDLLERVKRLDHKQRSTASVVFSLAPGLDIGVKVFTSIRKMYKPRIKLYKMTNEEVIIQKKEYLENGELLMSSDFLKYQEVGGKKLKFSLDEIKSLSKVYEPGIELLGFKPLSALKQFLYIKPANFIYPNETLVKGSQKLFGCLLSRCVARNVAPLVRVVARQGSAVAWGFLVPQEEVRDEGGCQEVPPGFNICYLPFADDFRSIQLESRVRASSEQVDAAKDVIKKLNFRYHPDCFENPDIQTHLRNVEALALNRHYLHKVDDYTVPDHRGIEKKAGRLIETFRAMVLSPSYDPDQAAKKRPTPAAAGGGSNPGAKRAKTTHDEPPLSVEELAKKKQVSKMKVDAMKEWLHSRGVRMTGKKKAQLEQDIYDQLQIDF